MSHENDAATFWRVAWSSPSRKSASMSGVVEWTTWRASSVFAMRLSAWALRWACARLRSARMSWRWSFEAKSVIWSSSPSSS